MICKLEEIVWRPFIGQGNRLLEEISLAVFGILVILAGNLITVKWITNVNLCMTTYNLLQQKDWTDMFHVVWCKRPEVLCIYWLHIWNDQESRACLYKIRVKQNFNWVPTKEKTKTRVEIIAFSRKFCTCPFFCSSGIFQKTSRLVFLKAVQISDMGMSLMSSCKMPVLLTCKAREDSDSDSVPVHYLVTCQDLFLNLSLTSAWDSVV